MTKLRDKIGQMLIIGFDGYELDEHSPVVSWLTHENLGGVLLFDWNWPAKRHGKNLKTREQIKRLTHQLKSIAKAHREPHLNLPLWVALDYEGGAVDRLARVDGCMKTKPASQQALLPLDAWRQEASEMAATLHDLGFNLNFAPVVDLNLNEEQGIIGHYGRSFSHDATGVIDSAAAFVTAFAKHGIICCYKHFPGHGSAVGDTHQGCVDVTETYQSVEQEPYLELLNDKTLPEAMVMTAHVINRHLDSSGLPATLSYPMITDILRQKIVFDGVVVSDDLQMQAISDHYSLDDALRLTLQAGADMVIFGNQLGDISATEVIDRIERLVLSGAINPARIEESYERIARLKGRMLMPCSTLC